MPMQWIGTERPAVESRAKVSGRCEYVADLTVPRMVWAHLVRSTCPHGLIKEIDKSGALEVPGVLAVVTGADLKSLGINLRFGPVFRDQSLLAVDKTIYAGEPVVAVVAESQSAAEEAASRVSVGYEPLPAVFDPLEAVAPGAPVIHEHVEPAGHFADVKHLHPQDNSNICTHFKLRHGNVEEGFALADRLFEHTFTTPAVAHVTLEPNVSVAAWASDGRLTVWSSTQSPSAVRSELAYLFTLSQSQVRVRVPYLGAGFGLKGYMKLEGLAAALAKIVDRPVKVALSLDETFVTLTKHATVVRLKTGVSHDGRILARRCEVYYDGGACADTGPRIAQKSGFTAAGPYAIPNVWIDSYRVYTNKVPAGGYRGFGIPQLVWAYESQNDEIARALGMDPLDFRQRNVLRAGDVHATGQVMESSEHALCLEKVAECMQRWPKQKNRGRGLALGMKAVLTPSISQATLTLFADGSASLAASTVDMGQGSDTIMPMLAAEVLGIPPEKVHMVHTDTDVTPYDTITAASRTTFYMGNAVVRAAEDVRTQLLKMASEQLEVAVSDLELTEGSVAIRGANTRQLTFSQIMTRHFGMPAGSILGRGDFQTEYRPLDSETGQSDRCVAFWFAAATGAEVEVDEDTGQIRVTRLVTAADAGRALNPRAVRHQLVGGAIQQLGQVLRESVNYVDGQIVNGNLIDYSVPGFEDLPGEIETVVIEVPAADGPFGAKGVGESATFAVAPAIANALKDLTGVRMCDLPLTPERVLDALRARPDAGPTR